MRPLSPMSPKLPVQPRSWGGHIDPLPSSPPLLSSAQVAPVMSHEKLSEQPEASFTMKQKEDKLPHDASVFVGSLPSNIDQGDLTRMLMEHLSDHIQIKNIKVVRDSKGGVCAFVQCENAASATALIQTLHSSAPKPFLGRILRYEPARAFRTLFISYRTPTQFVRSGAINTSNAAFKSDEVELELPDAMRVWKHRNSRFHSILYNAEALQAEEKFDRSESHASLLDNVVFLQPIKYDGETLHKLASYFGLLETFSALTLDTNEAKGDESDNNQGSITGYTGYTSYPAPHNAPRSPAMEKMCWEIKWEHRDDCVSALMTLRRVPHLTVTWAHQPASPGQIVHPNYPQVAGSPSYSFHAQHRAFPPQPFMHPVVIHSPRFIAPMETMSNAVDHPRQKNSFHQNHRFPYGPLEQAQARESAHSSWADESCVSDSKKDVYSSGLLEGEGVTTATLSQRPWADSCSSLADSTEDQEPKGMEYGDNDAVDDQFTGDTSTDLSGTIEAGTQELYMPQTPALDMSMSSITPVTPGSQFPATPTSSGYDASRDMPCKTFDDRKKQNVNAFKDSRTDREIDPTTLFVGGLEMFGPGAWDEEKVTKFFSRFGGLESVKVVRPLNSCAAFAFVKFDNAEAPARAVCEEHNRVYEGRAMRVQLRDCNPPRNNWKYGRARGRFHHNHFGVQRRSNYRTPYDGQEKNSFHLHSGGPSSTFDDPGEIPEIRHFSQVTAKSDPPEDENPLAVNSMNTSSSSLDAPVIASNSPQTEQYREWYDEPESPAHTPAPSSLGSSVSAAGIPFSASTYPYLSNGPYFPPPPWMHPYMPPAPYQVPYYASYPVYPPAPPQQLPQPITSPPGSDASGPATGPQHLWPTMGMYGSYIPYPVVSSRTHIIEHGHPPSATNQAPLMPTGFIQNEQGTLIAVYQPEALDQYMAGSGGTPAPLTNAQDAGPQKWVSCTTTRPHDMGNVPPPSPHAPPNQGRPRNAGASTIPTQRFHELQRSPVPFRGIDGTLNASSSPLYGRQGARREPQQNYNYVRNNNSHPRTFNGRSARPHVHSFGHGQIPGLGQRVGQHGLMHGDWDR